MQRERGKSLKAIGRTLETGDRYIRNIAQSKRFASDVYNGRGIGAARSRRYSRNTYMGINAG